MKTSLITLVLVCASLCDIAADAPQSTDQASIQGVWLAQSERQNGKTRSVAYQYIFRENKLTFKDENGKEMKYSFRLNTTNNPKHFIIQPVETATNSTPVSVAYELNGDSLTIAIASPGSCPTEISDTNNQELIICKRKSP